MNGASSSFSGSGCLLGDGQSAPSSQCDPHKAFQVVRRIWKDGDTVEITFRSAPRLTHWFHNAAVFERGPLIFALQLDARWAELKSYALKSADWQLEPQRAWNYSVLTGDCDATAQEHGLGSIPFNSQNPAVTLQIKGRQLPGWSVNENSAAAVPQSPVRSTAPLQTLTLVPYGAAKLRVTAFPFLVERSKCQDSALLH